MNVLYKNDQVLLSDMCKVVGNDVKTDGQIETLCRHSVRPSAFLSRIERGAWAKRVINAELMHVGLGLFFVKRCPQKMVPKQDQFWNLRLQVLALPRHAHEPRLLACMNRQNCGSVLRAVFGNLKRLQQGTTLHDASQGKLVFVKATLVNFTADSIRAPQLYSLPRTDPPRCTQCDAQIGSLGVGTPLTADMIRQAYQHADVLDQNEGGASSESNPLLDGSNVKWFPLMVSKRLPLITCGLQAAVTSVRRRAVFGKNTTRSRERNVFLKTAAVVA